MHLNLAGFRLSSVGSFGLFLFTLMFNGLLSTRSFDGCMYVRLPLLQRPRIVEENKLFTAHYLEL
jgi:hypothetical protein